MFHVRVFDWLRVAYLIRQWEPGEVLAGLRGDWKNTHGTIYENGGPVFEKGDDQACLHLASSRDFPALYMDGQVVDCWCRAGDTPGWNAQTYWPPEALRVLRGEA